MTSTSNGTLRTAQPSAGFLEVFGLSKTFDGTTVLSQAAMTVERGEVRALIGANGSGKSTFIKCLTGVQPADHGSRVVLDGRVMGREYTPKQAYSAGIRVVHQEAPLIDELSIADNFAIYHGFPTFGGVFVRDRRSDQIVRSALDRFGVDIPARTLAGNLPAAERAMVAIAISISDEAGPAKILVLDEPTASIPAADSERFLEAVHRASSQLGVILVTHRLQEVLEHCTHVTAFRDGHTVLDQRMDAVDRGALVDAIVGTGGVHRDNDGRGPDLPARFSPDIVRGGRGLELAGVSGERLVDVDLTVAPGEIVGVSGIVGSGAAEIGAILSGSVARTAGEIRVGDRVMPRRFGPFRSQRAGIGYVPSDRLRDGGLREFSVTENVALPSLGEYAFRRSQLRSDVQLVVDTLDVRPADAAGKPFGSLSGGNQQKVIVGKWALRRPDVLVLDDPMAGVDLGARAKIGELVRGLREAGTAILIISPDVSPLVELCDRVIALREGRVVGEITGAELTEKAVSLATL